MTRNYHCYWTRVWALGPGYFKPWSGHSRWDAMLSSVPHCVPYPFLSLCACRNHQTHGRRRKPEGSEKNKRARSHHHLTGKGWGEELHKQHGGFCFIVIHRKVQTFCVWTTTQAILLQGIVSPSFYRSRSFASSPRSNEQTDRAEWDWLRGQRRFPTLSGFVTGGLPNRSKSHSCPRFSSTKDQSLSKVTCLPRGRLWWKI